MACCALVALILSQCYLAFTAVRRWLRWGLGARSALATRHARWPRWLDFSPGRARVALAISLAAGGVAYAVDKPPLTPDAGFAAALMQSVCSATGLGLTR